MATSVLGLKTFAASDPVDYNEVNDNYVKIDNGVKTAMQGRAAHNLLDNSWFVGPVNQRGKTSYSGSKTYTIDRWVIASGGEVEVNSGYITLKNPTTSGRKAFEQILLKNHIGKTLTVACCVHSTGKVYCASAVVPTVSSSAQYFCQADFDGHSIRLWLSASGVLSVQIMIANDSNVSIRWVALYEGSYTADTLPAYVPKGYAAELAECQRYFQTYKVQIPQLHGSTSTRRYVINYRNRFRIIPTVTIVSATEYNVSTVDTGATFAINTVLEDFVRLNATGSVESTSGLFAYVTVNLSADL